MQGVKGSKLFFTRADGNLNSSSALRIHQPDREVVCILTRRLPSQYYDVEPANSLLRPDITCSVMEEIARPPRGNRKPKAL